MKRVPVPRWLRRYERRFIARDLAGGLAVGSMLIPQGLAFAQIVQVPPVAGLWSGIAAMIAYALFGPSRHLIVGPEAGTAMMVASVLTAAGLQTPEQRLEGAALLALMVGAALVVAGCFRLGSISNFLSRPILVGYINGVALVLVVSQLPGVLGIRSTQGDFFPQVEEVASKIPEAHGPTVWLSGSALLFLLVVRRVRPQLPGAVLVVVAGIALSALLGLEAHGLRVLGHIEQGLPALALPRLPEGGVLQLAPGALSIALLVFASSALTSRIFADKNRDAFRANRELFGVAAANVAAGLVNGVPAAGSDARTAINDASGSRTQAAGLFAAAFVAVILFFLASVMSLLPLALLGSVVIASALSLFDLRGFVRIFQLRRLEGVLAMATFVGVLVLGILPGVLVAVALSISDLVRRAAHPHDAVLGRLRGQPGYQDIEGRPGSETLPGLIIYRMDAPLFFANARFLREQVHGLVGAAETPVRMVVLDCGAMFDLDVTGAETLEELDRELAERGITLGLAEPHAPMRRVLRRSGLLEKLGRHDIFSTVGEAIRAYVERAEADLGRDIDWQRVSEPVRPSGHHPEP
ncbi:MULTISPECIES: sulfate permease [Myxococcaceae]|uniref:SulP family inorganic anion transporter n=1 Tax=Myxococcaceae TaxID=31 RepID=UPI00188F9071|nr:sulfate permease [Simulacricoccus sp. 17bor-14]